MRFLRFLVFLLKSELRFISVQDGVFSKRFNMAGSVTLSVFHPFSFHYHVPTTTNTETVFTTALGAPPTVFIPDLNTTISFRFSPDSDDVSFYIQSPDWFQYTAIGLGTAMSNSLMFITYPSSRGVTISPRLSSGATEPLFYPEARLTIHPNTGLRAHEMIVNATCHNCRTWPGGSLNIASGSQSIIFANGPGIELVSDDVSAGIRRHVGYGSYLLDARNATGSGPVVFPERLSAGDMVRLENVVQTGGSRAAVIHGVLFVVTTLALGPFDALIAGALARWPVVHVVSASLYVGFVIGSFVPGVMVSKEHVATQQMRTPHQVIGLLTVTLVFAMYLWGAAVGVLRRGAKKRGQEPPEMAVLLGKIHRWVGRFIWVLLVVSGGL